ncbi:hypothetical protein NEF87_004061 [Candidatus Lokiarchaeum ossiferum]|uniref:Uncharacterized protein n=1 Tax=Candidatus Lokiarchaeum ossiferum TaxID=2951803 RepID=A0ABY6HYX7_9ARCH|nr:hypothetical protein NEF87_004061 [Candidatus Lokiarchaeum sp. B-35]
MLESDKVEEIETFLKNQKKGKSTTVLIPCKKCNETKKIEINKSMVENVENFPFPIFLMHCADNSEGKIEIHTLIAYLDNKLNCRHVEFLEGNQVFITPFILYNSNLLHVYCQR